MVSVRFLFLPIRASSRAFLAASRAWAALIDFLMSISLMDQDSLLRNKKIVLKRLHLLLTALHLYPAYPLFAFKLEEFFWNSN